VPISLVISLGVSIAALAASTIFHFLNPLFELEYLIVIFNLGAIAIFLLLHRRNPAIVDCARWIAIIWGGMGLYFALTDEPLSPPHFFLDVLPFIESAALLVLFGVMKIPSNRRYLSGGSPPNTSFERTRER
jgi:hypothetical protein